MKKILPFLFILSFFSFQLFAQVAPSSVQIVNEPSDQKNWNDVRKHLDNLDKLNQKNSSQNSKSISPDVRQSLVSFIYRNSLFSELRLLAPSDNYQKEFADVLKQKDTGLIKMVKDFGCDELSEQSSDKTICKTFSMPGGGSAYSFRRKDYQFWKMSDIVYDGKVLFAVGELSQGFLVNIGKVGLERITRKTKGANFIFSFSPKQTVEGILEQNRQFINGVEFDGFLYKKYLPLVEGETYLLRSIAYQGNVFREYNGFIFNELDFDNRQDVIVAFSVLEKDFNGTLTILWKIIQTKKSPKLN